VAQDVAIDLDLRRGVLAVEDVGGLVTDIGDAFLLADGAPQLSFEGGDGLLELGLLGLQPFAEVLGLFGA
jgi:hypothetical protein